MKKMNENWKFDPSKPLTAEKLVDGLLHDSHMTMSKAMTWRVTAVCSDQTMNGREFHIIDVTGSEARRECVIWLEDSKGQKKNTITVMELKNKILSERVQKDYLVVLRDENSGARSSSMEKIQIDFSNEQIGLVFGRARP